MIWDPHKSSKCGWFVNNMIYYPNLDDIVCCYLYRAEKWMKSSKLGWFVWSNFGWKWTTICMIQFWMKVRIMHLLKLMWSNFGWKWSVQSTKHPILDDFTFIQNWTIQNIQFRKMHNHPKVIMITQNFHIWINCKHGQIHPKVDYTKLSILDDLGTCSLSSKLLDHTNHTNHTNSDDFIHFSVLYR